MLPKCGYAGLSLTLAPSSGLPSAELRTHLRNFKKVYRRNKTRRSDFKKFSKKSYKKGNKQYDIMKVSRTHQKNCYQSFIRSQNLKKLKLIDEKAYHRLKNQVKATSATSSSVAASQTMKEDKLINLQSDDLSNNEQIRRDSICDVLIKKGIQKSGFGKFRKLSCSSTANSDYKIINNANLNQNLISRKSSISKKYLNQSPDRYNDNAKKSKGCYFSVDKAATPNINKSSPHVFKSPSFDALEIWEDCNVDLFSELEKKQDQRDTNQQQEGNFRLVI